MTKQEFLDHVKSFPEGKRVSTVTDDKYSVIELVYTFHPAISDTDGKIQIAELYVKFGWSVIMDMKPRAELMAAKERERADLKASLLALEQDMDIIKNGGWL